MLTIIDAIEANKVIYALVGAAATASGIWWLLSRPPYVHDSRGRSPPGPKRKLFVDNIGDFPTTRWFEEFRKLQKEYGDIVYFQIPGRPILLLNSFEDADDLLVKRAAIWSDRAHNYMMDKMMSIGWTLVMIAPGEALNEMRKIFRQVFGPRTVMEFDTVLEEGADDFRKALSRFSGDPEKIVSLSIGSAIIRLAYGKQVAEKHGPKLVDINSKSMDLIAWAESQIWLVNIFPIARFLPSWLPGLKFPAYAKQGREYFDKIRYWAFTHVKHETADEPADPCVVTKYFGPDERSNGYLRDAASMMYFAGVDTSAASLMNFFANMVLYPEVQRKIHEELDEVIGQGRIPTMADVSAENLVYLRATWNESLRNTPTVHVAVPHSAVRDDNWRGYHLPKGTLVLPNQGFMLSDPRIWGKDAHLFRPERFIETPASELPDMETLVYGFGRRRCPGRYIAERSGMLFAAVALAAFDVVPAAGQELPVTIEYTTDKVRRPTNLKCSFVPRQ